MADARMASDGGVTAMLLILLFLVLVVGASIAGLTADSRDGADWAPTVSGVRQPRY